MSDLRIRINCDNAAFGETPEEAAVELRRILGALVGRIDCHETEGIIYDANGNRCGAWAFGRDPSND
jgi:hypothetical protein